MGLRPGGRICQESGNNLGRVEGSDRGQVDDGGVLRPAGGQEMPAVYNNGRSVWLTKVNLALQYLRTSCKFARAWDRVRRKVHCSASVFKSSENYFQWLSKGSRSGEGRARTRVLLVRLRDRGKEVRLKFEGVLNVQKKRPGDLEHDAGGP